MNALLQVSAPVAAAFAALDEGGVRWCLLRGREELGAPVGDIDLLVEAGRIDRVSPLLWPLGFRRISLPGRGTHRFFLRYDAPSGTWVKLDIVTEIDFGRYQEYRTTAAAGILARARATNGIPEPAPGDDYRLLLVHYLLDGSPRRVRHRARLQEWAAGGRASLAGADWNLPAQLTTALDAAVAAGEWDRLTSMTPEVIAALGGGSGTSRRRLANRATQWLARRVPRPGAGGTSIALMGPDGSGKSTLLASLGTDLPVPVRQTYMGAYGASFGTSRRIAGLALPAKLLKLWRGYVRGSLHAAAGGLTIYDRYPFDALLPAGAKPSRRASLRRWILGHSCPPPDLVVILDAPAETLFARKPEHDLEAFTAQRAAYRSLAARLSSAALIDATRPTEELRRSVTEMMWRRYARRLRRP